MARTATAVSSVTQSYSLNVEETTLVCVALSEPTSSVDWIHLRPATYSPEMGIMEMDPNNIQLKTTVECRSPNATDVVLRVNPLIPRGMSRNVAVLTTPYKLIVSAWKIQRGM